jgi:hypothetical protein
MQLAEDSRKVHRIVTGSRQGLNAMYPDTALLNTFPCAGVRRTGNEDDGDTRFARCTQEGAQVALLQELPTVRLQLSWELDSCNSTCIA